MSRNTISYALRLAGLKRACGIVIGIGLGIGIWNCALKVDDPVANLQEKIAQGVNLTDSLLMGQWEGDSTYTLSDTRATVFTQKRLQLWLYRDGRYRIGDSGQTLFQKTETGVFNRLGDSLWLSPDVGTQDIYIAKLTFMGNYLSLYQPAKRRFCFFHRLPRLDTVDRESYLSQGPGRWILIASRDSSDRWKRESWTQNFEYWIFGESRCRREQWKFGQPNIDTTTVSLGGDTLKLSGNTPRAFILEALHRDTLRLWPLRGQKTDSGFIDLVRRDSVPPMHRDLQALPGYWRTDSLKDSSALRVLDYDHFYDLEFSRDGELKTTLHGMELPAFTTWSLDSGIIRLSGNSSEIYRLPYRLTTIGDTSHLFFELAPLPSRKFITRFYLTRVNGSSFATHPAARFPELSHAILVVGKDTLSFLQMANWSKSEGEKAELAAALPADTSWMILQLPTVETFSSDQPKFQFRLMATLPSLGKFECASTANLPLTMRVIGSVSGPSQAGTLQGKCRLIHSAKATSDTALDVAGEYRVRRIQKGPLLSPLWTRPE